MLPLFEQRGGGMAGGIDRLFVISEKAIELEKYVIYLKCFREVGQNL